jgi:hypothetical protein
MAFSLPGMSELAMRTVSPSVMLTGWSRLAILASAAIGSPWEPVATIVIWSGRRRSRALRSLTTRPSGIVR